MHMEISYASDQPFCFVRDQRLYICLFTAAGVLFQHSKADRKNNFALIDSKMDVMENAKYNNCSFGSRGYNRWWELPIWYKV